MNLIYLALNALINLVITKKNTLTGVYRMVPVFANNNVTWEQNAFKMGWAHQCNKIGNKIQ